jgi:hypothetical protein
MTPGKIPKYSTISEMQTRHLEGLAVAIPWGLVRLPHQITLMNPASYGVAGRRGHREAKATTPDQTSR